MRKLLLLLLLLVLGGASGGQSSSAATGVTYKPFGVVLTTQNTTPCGGCSMVIKWPDGSVWTEPTSYTILVGGSHTLCALEWSLGWGQLCGDHFTNVTGYNGSWGRVTSGKITVWGRQPCPTPGAYHFSDSRSYVAPVTPRAGGWLDFGNFHTNAISGCVPA